MGISGRLLEGVKSLYKDVKYTVRVNGHLSPWFQAPRGVKQGCLISPLLFSLYVNDLAETLNDLNCGIDVHDKNIGVLLYADDIVLIAPSEDKLQRMLDRVHEWCYKWRISVNQKKTKVMHFRPKTVNCTQTIFTIGDINISCAENYRYLGIWLNEHLDFSVAINELAKSASRALGALCTKYFDAGGFSYEVFTKLYESLVQPITLYGSAIWGLYEQKRLNTIQNKACKFFLGLRRNSSNTAARGDMGWTSNVTKQRLEVYRYLNRLHNMPHHRLPYSVHVWSRCRGQSWENNVFKLAKRLNIFDYINEQHIDLQHLRRRLFQIDESQWFGELWNDRGNPNGNKLRTYRLVKKDLKPEPHVICQNLPRNIRKYLSLLRCGSLQLNIENLRYSRPLVPLCDRVCPFCPNKVESEIHFLMECTMYNDIRYNIMSEMEDIVPSFSSLDSLQQFICILTTPNVMYILCHSISSMFKRRQLFF